MAVSKNGNDGFIGRVGNTVVYPLNGKMVKREIGISTKPPTELQLAARQVTTIIAKLLNPVKEFINVGFELDGKLEQKNANNMAASYNRFNAVSGIYPNQFIDFKKILLSKGNMPLAKQVAVRLVENDLEFTWDTAADRNGMRWSDQVMMLAYFPEVRDAVFLMNGVRRMVGMDRLRLPSFKKPVLIETYLSFISADHKLISNSIYTGQIIYESE